MFYSILDKKRLALLPLFKAFKNDFYLAGGTGLALQLGYRDSIDFDFFSKKEFKTDKLFLQIKKVFKEYKIVKIIEDQNTLTIMVDKTVKISFFGYPYKLIDELIDQPYLKIASIRDIACMKISAIVSRATNKDYIDLYFIFKKLSLKKILKDLVKKFPDLDANLALKSLVHFDDIIMGDIRFKNNQNVDFKTVRGFIEKEVTKISK